MALADPSTPSVQYIAPTVYALIMLCPRSHFKMTCTTLHVIFSYYCRPALHSASCYALARWRGSDPMCAGLRARQNSFWVLCLSAVWSENMQIRSERPQCKSVQCHSTHVSAFCNFRWPGHLLGHAGHGFCWKHFVARRCSTLGWSNPWEGICS